MLVRELGRVVIVFAIFRRIQRVVVDIGWETFLKPGRVRGRLGSKLSKVEIRTGAIAKVHRFM